MVVAEVKRKMVVVMLNHGDAGGGVARAADGGDMDDKMMLMMVVMLRTMVRMMVVVMVVVTIMIVLSLCMALVSPLSSLGLGFSIYKTEGLNLHLFLPLGFRDPKKGSANIGQSFRKERKGLRESRQVGAKQ